MKVNWERVEKNTVELKVEVPAEEVSKALDKAYRKVVKQVNMPGFRKGHVPRQLLEARYGIEILYEDAVDFMLPDAYADAVAESGIEPVDRPEIVDINIEKDQPFTFTAKVTVKPEVELGQYKGLTGEKPITEVTEESVQSELERMREAHARIEVQPEEEPIADGDYAIINFEGFVDGEAFEGGSGEDYQLVIGSGTFIPGFEEQLIGAKAGDQVEVNVTFPEDYRAEHLAGKDALFKVKINEVKRRLVPELDADFVMEISEFDTVEELKDDAENKLKRTAEDQANQALRNDVVKKAVDAASVDIPEVMVEDELERMVEEVRENFTRSGIPLERYLEMLGKSMEEFKEEMRPGAESRTKTDLVLEKIVAVENIDLSEEEMGERLQEIADAYKQPVESVREMLEERGSLDTLKKGYQRDKAIDLLVDSCEVVMVDTKEEETQEENEEVENSAE